MNIILFEEKEISSTYHIQITDHRAKHIVKVLRSQVGDRVRVGVIDGGRGMAKIVAIKPKFPFSVDLDIQLETTLPEEKPVIDLVLALPRPIMLRRILSQVTSLGVGRIFLIDSQRVEKSFWQASLLQNEQYREHLLIGLEQAVATRLPEVSIYPKFKGFMDELLVKDLDDYSALIVADPAGTNTFSEALRQAGGSLRQGGRVLLCVGPEGGWVPAEVDQFSGCGFSICTIGERILKVDTAVIALHSRIMALREIL
ncbi:16S rRNA (uracil(1498)-N(3))-methyltransferase [Desulfotalea psychrophila]|uniref:Ribosomal RNA small subunit methyltransferase E n=1 Tax=Desulfotalea psychrophila (strain LSv54 / DSM 12343) TaxID=177439 RepID=Q6AMJ0_DESPS|nr:16S rRNA (uracil(1498)-N(3))-methyltransferase [Desulfotalea psychrophila]CAG36435.1 conserved hypothetical protein [Desulfotalea psychrophila LSv54]